MSIIIFYISSKMNELTGVEVLGWYDGIAYRQDQEGKRFSRGNKLPIDSDELCRPGEICKVEQVGEYNYKIISSRKDSIFLAV